jgi:phage tail-like protein
MASDNSALWPVGGFYFKVNIPDINDDLECTEVTGLKLKSKNMDYRPGNDPTFIMLKIPGLKEFENLTIKKAVFKQDIALYTWYKSIQSGENDQERKDIIITLHDEQGDPIMSWTVLRSFPISYSGPDLKSTDSQIAFESIELTHQGIEQALV